jgi:hypothetical protein
MSFVIRFGPPVVRVLCGFTFVVFGLEYFLQIWPRPPFPEPATAFLDALIRTGYVFALVKVMLRAGRGHRPAMPSVFAPSSA